MLKCKACGKECKKQVNQFCSRSCSVKYRNLNSEEYRDIRQNKCCQCSKKCARKFCSKKCSMIYRHTHKEEYKDYFNKLSQGRSKKSRPSMPCLHCGKKTPRYYNKFCSQQCAFDYRKKHPEEYQDSYDIIRQKRRVRNVRSCLLCDERFYPSNDYNIFCCNLCFKLYRQLHPSHWSPDSTTAKQTFAKLKADKQKYAAWCHAISERMKKNNPMHDPNVVEKSKQSCKKYWDEHPEEKHARIQRFIQAPMRSRGQKWKPTSLEQKIIDLQIPDLSYTGDGSVFMTIGCKRKRKKNPDFLLRGKSKVIEVGDTQYWHTIEEIKETVADYNCIGYQCLYLTDHDMVDPSYYSQMIENFITRDNR